MRWVSLAVLLAAGCGGIDPATEALFCELCTAEDALVGGDGGAGGETGATTGQGGGPPPCLCDDGDPCNGVESCAGDGSCVSGPPQPAMSDNNLCTDDICHGGVTHHRPIVPEDRNPCTSNACIPESGPFHPTGPFCIECTDMDDHDACTIDECDSFTGISRHYIINPDDGDPCTIDSCDRINGTSHQRDPGCQS